jgi:nitronate monooxygenase
MSGMWLRARLGLERPVIQAPMAGAQDVALAAAVGRAGGVGSLPAAMLTPDALRSQIAALRELTTAPFNVNFFCHPPPVPDAEREARWRARLRPYFEELGLDHDARVEAPARQPFDAAMAEVVEDLRPAVVSFHFGLPDETLLARVRATGALTLSSATNLHEALWLEQHGVDAVIAQGVEAGGHQGHFLDGSGGPSGLELLLPRLVDALRIPVVAAGGIVDERTADAARRLGAAAVQAGTAYLLCPEATTSTVHRAALRSSAVRHTVLTNVLTGRAARGIVNRVVRELGPLSADVPAFPLAAAAMAPLRQAAEARGSGDFSPLWAGVNALLCRESSAAEVTQRLAGG